MASSGVRSHCLLPSSSSPVDLLVQFNPMSPFGPIHFRLVIQVDQFSFCRLRSAQPTRYPRFDRHAGSAYLRSGRLVSLLRCVETPRYFAVRDRPFVLFSRHADRCSMPRSMGHHVYLYSLDTGFEVRLKYPKDGVQLQSSHLPFVFNDQLYVTYTLCPHVVLKCDMTSGDSSTQNEMGRGYHWHLGIWVAMSSTRRGWDGVG
mmetsp:Transcript_31099/g.70275  ORF Transcript_31099/g.70275 Transcript_31099/m.70275 type:complete len:203 (+) Transcript_31099:693-1301(+)